MQLANLKGVTTNASSAGKPHFRISLTKMYATAASYRLHADGLPLPDGFAQLGQLYSDVSIHTGGLLHVSGRLKKQPRESGWGVQVMNSTDGSLFSLPSNLHVSP
jgi:hypothetical protein